jgi:fructosamine-3-kinase
MKFPQFFLEQQRKIYEKYGTVIELDGTYKTKNAGFTLYHLLIHDNNGDGPPVAFLFVNKETTDTISKCLQIFTEVNKFTKLLLYIVN